MSSDASSPPKHSAELLREMGFNPDRPLTTQHALLRHLLKAAADLQPENVREAGPRGEQLGFDPAVLGLKKR